MVPTPPTAPSLESLLARCTFAPSGPEALAAVSGGPDSLALLALAVASGVAVTAVHVDHGLRPGSAAEADVVADAARRFGARFRSETVVVAQGADLEQRARLARRGVLGPDAMTGHTADDQAETVLINLLRGAGVPGLAAIEPGPTHPILALRRAETVLLCQELGLTPVTDPSNDDPRFVRNRIRHEVLPLLADVADRDPVPLLARTAWRAREMHETIVGLAASVDPTDTRGATQHPPAVYQQALRQWLTDDLGHPPSTAELDRVLAVVRHEVQACELSGNRRVARTDGVLRVETSGSDR